MWPFSRIRRSAPVRPPLLEDWQAGDVAECIRDDWVEGPPKRPQRGSRSMVGRVVEGRSGTGELGHGLELFRFAGRWNATAFRKVRLSECGEEVEAEALAPVERSLQARRPDQAGLCHCASAKWLGQLVLRRSHPMISRGRRGLEALRHPLVRYSACEDATLSGRRPGEGPQGMEAEAPA